MTTHAVRFENVVKHYRGAATYRALRDDLGGVLRGRLPHRQAGEVHALDGISFDIAQGATTALIGVNGAGKTTALKVMCRITYPTSGSVTVRGRIGALIEVGSGMHPELTGRENIWLYGQIMGLAKHDIARRFDDIVDFAELPTAIDRKVKHYSSGMMLRLGFSVAAHLEPDIFVVDEAISVGDAGFQHKCAERMTSLVREGTTLILVSHDLHAIEALCDRALLLDHGGIRDDGPAPDVIRGYLEGLQLQRLQDSAKPIQGAGLTLTAVEVMGHGPSEVISNGSLRIRVAYTAEFPIVSPIVSIGLSEGTPRPFAMASMLNDGYQVPDLSGQGTFELEFPRLPLNPKVFEVWGSVRGAQGYGDIIDWQRWASFRVLPDSVSSGGGAIVTTMADSPVRLDYSWRFES